MEDLQDLQIEYCKLSQSLARNNGKQSERLRLGESFKELDKVSNAFKKLIKTKKEGNKKEK